MREHIKDIYLHITKPLTLEYIRSTYKQVYTTNITEWTTQLQFYIDVERVITTISCISLPLPLQLLSLSILNLF